MNLFKILLVNFKINAKFVHFEKSKIRFLNLLMYWAMLNKIESTKRYN